MHPRNISLGVQRPIFMKTFTNKDKYPFAFYCNATGDLFIPDTDLNGTPRDLKDMSGTPIPGSRLSMSASGASSMAG